MTRLLLAAAALVVMLAEAGVGAGAEWHVHPGAGTPIQDATQERARKCLYECPLVLIADSV